MLKRGKSPEKLKTVLSLLLNEQSLPPKYRNHKLTGDWKGRSECHIEPDWLLIYFVKENKLVAERTGSHSNLFD